MGVGRTSLWVLTGRCGCWQDVVGVGRTLLCWQDFVGVGRTLWVCWQDVVVDVVVGIGRTLLWVLAGRCCGCWQDVVEGVGRTLWVCWQDAVVDVLAGYCCGC